MKLSNIPKNIVNFLKEIKLEIRKVNWPSRKETVRDTLIVLGVSIVVAIFLGGMDAIFKEILNRLMQK